MLHYPGANNPDRRSPFLSLILNDLNLAYPAYISREGIEIRAVSVAFGEHFH